MSPTSPIIADVQNTDDTRQIAINKVGIKAIRHPIKVQDKSSGIQHTIAMFNMYVGLPHNFKGTHMSRFVEILNSHEREISVENFPIMLREMLVKLEAETGHIEMNFPLPMTWMWSRPLCWSLRSHHPRAIWPICSIKSGSTPVWQFLLIW